MSLNLPVLAIDPGKKAGGAAILYPEGTEVQKAWAWRERTLKGETLYEITDSNGRTTTRKTLAGVGRYLSERSEMGWPYALVVEGLFVGASKKESLTLEWSAGVVAGFLIPDAEGDIMRPTSMQWRPEVVGIPGNTKAKDAADLAKKWVAENLPGMGALADNEHACEAACQAVYGWRYVNGKLAA